MNVDHHPELNALFEFYAAQRSITETPFSHSPGLIPKPTFFSVRKLQEHLNNPLLTPNWIALVSGGQFVPLEPAHMFKEVQSTELHFTNKALIDEHLARGAALVLEGLDIMDPSINAFAARLDSALPCALTNVVAFFSQRGNEAYKGHADRDDVLVIQLSGEKQWSLFTPRQRRLSDKGGFTKEQMGRPIKEIKMRSGDALYLRAGTPHICQTTGTHSLHISFDLRDLTPTVWKISEAANARFAMAASEQYASATRVIDQYVDLLRSEPFRNEAEMATAQVRNEALAFRRRIGSTSTVRALGRFTENE
jgi:ribosomal protein L16 Arg81 hydroxylase